MPDPNPVPEDLPCSPQAVSSGPEKGLAQPAGLLLLEVGRGQGSRAGPCPVPLERGHRLGCQVPGCPGDGGNRAALQQGAAGLDCLADASGIPPRASGRRRFRARDLHPELSKEELEGLL